MNDVSGNDLSVSGGNPVSETQPDYNTQTNVDISGGNSFFESAQSSGNEEYSTTQEVPVTDTAIIVALENINNTATTLLFLVLFVWIEGKVHSGVRRLSEKWKK